MKTLVCIIATAVFVPVGLWLGFKLLAWVLGLIGAALGAIGPIPILLMLVLLGIRALCRFCDRRSQPPGSDVDY